MVDCIKGCQQAIQYWIYSNEYGQTEIIIFSKDIAEEVQMDTICITDLNIENTQFNYYQYERFIINLKSFP